MPRTVTCAFALTAALLSALVSQPALAAKRGKPTTSTTTTTTTTTRPPTTTTTTTTSTTTSTAPNQLPVANAGPNKTGNVGVAVSFNGSGSFDPDGTIVTYWWNFGDGTPAATTAIVSHAYTATGTYTVTLWVQDNRGAWSVGDTATATISTGGTTTSTIATTTTTSTVVTTTTVAATTSTQPATTTTVTTTSTTTTTAQGGNNQMPNANAGPDQFTQSQTAIVFNGAGSNDPDGSIVAWTWSYGDGTPNGSGSVVSHTYATPGSYTATLTVTDNKGATDPDTAAVTVANRPPVANAGPDRSVIEDTSVAFSGTGSSDPDGTITSYAWAFGDGQTGSGATPSHVYPAPGTFTVILTVTDNKGAQASDTAVVTVSAAGGGWARAIGSTAGDAAYAAATDSAGNMIVGGGFRGTVNFGGTTLTSAGGADWFLAKYSPTGTLLWAKRMGGTSNEQLDGLAVDGNGDVVVAGRFAGSANLGGTALVSAGGFDIGVAKYSGSNGAHVWSKRFGGTADDVAEAVAVDTRTGVNDVIVTGGFSGTVNFGGGPVSVPYVSDSDAYVLKLTSAGAYSWVKTFTNTGNEVGLGVATDTSGNIAVTGYFTSSINFGTGSLVSLGNADVFVAKLTSTGAAAWAKAFGNNLGSDQGNAVAMDASGNVFVVGDVSGAVNFGGGSLSGGADGFVAKYSASSGTHQWSRRLGGLQYDYADAVRVDASGNVVVAGSFGATADFGGTSLSTAGLDDAYAAKYQNTGALVSVRQLGGASSDYAEAVAVASTGHVIVAGSFNGSGSFAGTVITSAGLADGYLARLAP